MFSNLITFVQASLVTLLFPLHHGEALPITKWSADGSTLILKTDSGCTDTLKFSLAASEPFERVALSRGSATAMAGPTLNASVIR